MEEKYYGVLMKKIQIHENIAIYIPERIISGFISDAIGEDNIAKVFVEEGYGKEYLFMDDVRSILPPNDDIVGFQITEKELMDHSAGLSLNQAQMEYFDNISEKERIGFYIPEKFEDKLIFLDLGLEALKYELSEADTDEAGNINISYYDVISSLVNLNSFNELVKLDEQQLDMEEEKNQVTFEKISLEDIIDEANNQVVEKVLEEYSKRTVEEQEETFEQLLNKLKLLSPEDLIRCNDIERMEEKMRVVKSTCNKMEQIIEDSKVDEKIKKAVLKTVDSLKCYYDEKIGKISDLETIQYILQAFGFIYDKNIDILEDYNQLLNKSVQQSEKQENELKKSKFNKPFSVKDVKEKCDRVIIGQEDAKEAVISTVYMNQKERNHLTKNTLLLVGPTGSGKTLIAETVADILDIPSVSIDTTQLTIAGYKGADIENYLATLINRAGGDKEKAEHGIVIFDEFDKKGSENNDDVSGKGVLNSLLPFIQGTLYKVSMGKGDKTVDFNTNHLTILVAGSCTDAIKAKEKEQNKVLGFATKTEEKKETSEYCKITKEDVEKYCNIPEEFMGRVSNMVQLQPHTKDTIRQILLESDISPLLSEKEKLGQDDIDLSWNDEYIENLSEKVLQDTHGVRALKEFIETSIMSARWKVLHEEDLFNGIVLNGKSIENPDETVLVYKDGNYTTVKELKEKENLEKSKVKEKSNDKK